MFKTLDRRLDTLESLFSRPEDYRVSRLSLSEYLFLLIRFNKGRAPDGDVAPRQQFVQTPSVTPDNTGTQRSPMDQTPDGLKEPLATPDDASDSDHVDGGNPDHEVADTSPDEKADTLDAREEERGEGEDTGSGAGDDSAATTPDDENGTTRGAGNNAEIGDPFGDGPDPSEDAESTGDTADSTSSDSLLGTAVSRLFNNGDDGDGEDTDSGGDDG
jgi:hypothetical protein